MGAIPPHDTATVDGTWDGGANVNRIQDGASKATLRKMYAWVDSEKDPLTKAAYKFPHHEVSDTGSVGAANLNGVRNALARLPQSNVPESDWEAVKKHLQHHLDMAKAALDGEGDDDELPLVTRDFIIRSLDAQTRCADFVASTDAIDSYGEIVEQDWVLDDYLKNPIVLYAHQSRDLPIGQCVDVGMRDGQLECRIQFATAEMNPKAEQVWQLVKGKFLRAVSVGFMPTNMRWEMRDGADVMVLSGNCLKEISVTPVPANAEALAKMRSRAARASSKAQPATDTTVDAVEENQIMSTDLEKKLVDATARLAEIDQRSKDAVVKAVEFEQRAATAEAKQSIAEKALRVSEEKLAKLETERTVRETEHTKACADRDAAVKRADDAEAKLIELEVDMLVGKKIAPTEKDDFIKLRKSSPELFASMVTKRADMKLTERVTESDTKANGTADPANVGTDTSGEIWNTL
jgi:HK97 family phage prohead protease